MNVLLLCNDYWHPGQVPIDGVLPLKDRGFNFDIITDSKEFKTEMLSKYPVVIIAKANNNSNTDESSWKSQAVQNAFVKYVEDGGGLIAIHAGLVPGENTETLDRLIGARFMNHPPSTLVTVQPIKPHPIADGVDMFCDVDEQYRLKIISDDVDIFMASYSPAYDEENGESIETDDPYSKNQAWIDAAGYVRTQGKGRVCALSPGHYLAIWHSPQFQRLLENAINWCSENFLAVSN
jgi:type 1 glutamine amidotransferase